MNSANICRFIPDSSENEKLHVINFVLETKERTFNGLTSSSIYQMYYVKNGEGILHTSQGKHRLVKGDLFFTFPSFPFAIESVNDFEYMYISFRGGRSDELFRRFGIRPSSCYYQGFDGLIPMWKNSLSRAVENNIDLTAESILLYTFSKFTTDNSNSNNLIKQIMEITEEDFSNPQLSISTIAQQLGYSSKYLSHLFKQKAGTGYTEYLQSYRLKYAISLFEIGLDSIKNVALLSGFTDPLYFSTVFKNKIGVTPKIYIQKLSDKSEG
jgi:AraC-like DNA-binding protein